MALLLADVAQAGEAPSAVLAYTDETGLPSCPGESVLRRGVSSRLGRSPFVESADKRVAVTLTLRGRAGLVGRVESFEGATLLGEREVTTDTRDCPGLTDALELAVALAIDPVAAMQGPPAEPVVERRVVTVAPKPEPVPEPTQDAPVEPRRLRARPVIEERPVVVPKPVASPRPEPALSGWQFAAALDAAIGGAPGLAPALTAEVSVVTWQWSLGLEARHAFRGAGPLVKGDVGLSHTTAALTGCGLLGWLDLCALAGGGLAIADGRGLDDDFTASGLEAFVGGRAGIRFAISPSWFLRVDATLLVPLTSVTLRVSDVPVWTTPPLAFSGGIRVGRVLW